jgi:hypothetical protein
MQPRKIKAVDRGMPRSKPRFTLKIREDGMREVVYRLREKGKPTRVFHYVYNKRLKLLHWHEKSNR